VAESCVCIKEQDDSSFVVVVFFHPIFLHEQDYKYNFCASSSQVHAPLSFFLDEMAGFRDERLHVSLSPRSLPFFFLTLWFD